MSKDIGRPGGLSSLRDQAPAGLAHSASIPDAIGFTGTQVGWTDDQTAAATFLLRELRAQGFVWMRNGDCIGSDSEAGWLWKRLGGKIILHRPTIIDKRTFLPAEILLPHKPYLERNRDIADLCARLVATPEQQAEQRRSGTWATIRHARRAGKPLCIIWPNGDFTRENWPAQAIEARRAETGTGSVHESAVPTGCAQENPQSFQGKEP